MPGVDALRAEGFTPIEELTGFVTVALVWPEQHRRSVPETRDWWLAEPLDGKVWLIRSPWPEWTLDDTFACLWSVVDDERLDEQARLVAAADALRCPRHGHVRSSLACARSSNPQHIRRSARSAPVRSPVPPDGCRPRPTLTHVRARLGGGGRLLGVDVARSLALFGMMSVHIFPAFPADGSRFTRLRHRGGPVGRAVRDAGRGRPRAGFRAARDRRTPAPGCAAARAGVLARAVLLVALGLLLGQVNSPPLVILAYYGLLFVLAIPFLGLSARTLARARRRRARC